MIGEHVYKLLVKLGQISEYYGDQDLLYRFVNLLEDIKYKSIPVAYNVNRPAYDYLGKKIFDRDKHKLIFHHYSGRKPWDDRYRKEHTWVDEYWLSEFTRAKEFFLLK
jgi:lipopolysaccharide biosynthesis glycosyltransferase